MKFSRDYKYNKKRWAKNFACLFFFPVGLRLHDQKQKLKKCVGFPKVTVQQCSIIQTIDLNREMFIEVSSPKRSEQLDQYRINWVTGPRSEVATVYWTILFEIARKLLSLLLLLLYEVFENIYYSFFFMKHVFGFNLSTRDYIFCFILFVHFTLVKSLKASRLRYTTYVV